MKILLGMQLKRNVFYYYYWFKNYDNQISAELKKVSLILRNIFILSTSWCYALDISVLVWS